MEAVPSNWYRKEQNMVVEALAIAALAVASVSLAVNVVLWRIGQKRYQHVTHTARKALRIMLRGRDLLRQEIAASQKQVIARQERDIDAALQRFEAEVIGPLRWQQKKLTCFAGEMEEQVEHAAAEVTDPRSEARTRSLMRVLRALGKMFPRRSRERPQKMGENLKPA